MSMDWVLAGFISGLWGILWACVLQFTPWGRWAAIKRTWLTVVIGVGGTLLASLVAVHWFEVLGIVWLFAMSSIGIIGRSLINEWREDKHG